jgi:hypothetical protein
VDARLATLRPGSFGGCSRADGGTQHRPKPLLRRTVSEKCGQDLLARRSSPSGEGSRDPQMQLTDITGTNTLPSL